MRYLFNMVASALLISFTPLKSEPRVLRQIYSLRRSGWRVFVAGFQPLIDSDDCEVIQMAIESEGLTYDSASQGLDSYSKARTCVAHVGQHLATFRRRIQKLLRNFVFGPGGVVTVLFRVTSIQVFRNRLADFWFRNLGFSRLETAPGIAARIRDCGDSPDLVLCHDYYTLPLGIELAREFNAEISVDSHEHAISRDSNEPGWTKFISPIIETIERKLLEQVATVTTVSDGIRDALNSTYTLNQPAVTIRSVPFFEEAKLREPDGSVKILYSGGICEGRNLESLVAALAHTPHNFSLTFRGSESDSGFTDKLHNIARQVGVTGRFRILDPVPFHDIVNDSTGFDVGIHVPLDRGIQMRYSLPNKLFDYIMAGLALCVADLPEMRRIVKTFGCGELVEGGTPEQIGATLRSISGGQLNSYKRKSLAAAQRLNWEKEEQLFAGVVAKTLGR